jgi:hypothetical protein
MPGLSMTRSVIMLDRLPTMTRVSGWTTNFPLWSGFPECKYICYLMNMLVMWWMQMIFFNGMCLYYSAPTTLMEMSSFHKFFPFWNIWVACITWQPRLRRSHEVSSAWWNFLFRLLIANVTFLIIEFFLKITYTFVMYELLDQNSQLIPELLDEFPNH